ncbi:hypothetical protein HPB51_026147 [Rhipicephalus microplus]|uniref:Uncharacterized protein n=1 Tax=Rhipicephalus microplus TaxID=6941 RepID=A0A9J6EKI7_RHIMP|nr:hypothetical protein HPB51_026147 [Rhipicephalus microplus]
MPSKHAEQSGSQRSNEPRRKRGGLAAQKPVSSRGGALVTSGATEKRHGRRRRRGMSRRHLRYDEPPQTALLLLRPKMRQARVLTHKSYRAAPEEAVLYREQGERATTARRGEGSRPAATTRIRVRGPVRSSGGAHPAGNTPPTSRPKKTRPRFVSACGERESARKGTADGETRDEQFPEPACTARPPSPRRAVAIPSPERPPSRAHITLQPPSRTAALGQPRINEAVPVSAFDAALAHCKQVCVLSPGAANPLSSSRRERPPTDYTVDKQGETSHSATQRHQQDPGFPAQRSPSDNAEEENVDET